MTGTVDGSKVTWKYDVDYSGTSITLTYTGTLDDSGKITGTIDVQLMAFPRFHGYTIERR